MSEIVVSKTDLGLIDIKKFVYDSLASYLPLIEVLGVGNIYFRPEDTIYDKTKPIVSISEIGGNTNFKGIRNQSYQIDVWATSVEEAEKIKYIIIGLLNRRNFKGIKSLLKGTGPDMSNPKNGLFREILFFKFVFKDQKY